MEHSLRLRQEAVIADSAPVWGRDLSERLWCVHIAGLDDFIAVDSQETAEREAADINAYIGRCGNGHGSTKAMRASAVEWPFAPASHARSLAEDLDDLQRMLHRRTGAEPPKRVLTTMTRRVKDFIGLVLRIGVQR